MSNKIKLIITAIATILIALLPAYQDQINTISEQLVIITPAVLSIIAVVSALWTDKPGKKE